MARVIDPMETIRIDMERRQGVRTQRGVVSLVQRGLRSTPVQASPRRGEQLTWYRASIGGSGDAAYLARRAYPSSDSAWAMSNNQIMMPHAGRIVGGRLEIASAEACTGGTAQLRVRVVDGNRTSDLDLSGILLSVAWPISIAKSWPYAKAAGYAFAQNSTLEVRIVTLGTWAPTTADVTAVVVVEYDD